MKLPKKVVIGGLDFKIKTGNGNHHVRERQVGALVEGLSQLDRQEIFVSANLAPGYSRVVLLHEILHMVQGVTGQDVPADEEEAYVARTAATLLSVLRSNPEVLMFLIEGIDG